MHSGVRPGRDALPFFAGPSTFLAASAASSPPFAVSTSEATAVLAALGPACSAAVHQRSAPGPSGLEVLELARRTRHERMYLRRRGVIESLATRVETIRSAVQLIHDADAPKGVDKHVQLMTRAVAPSKDL